MKRLHKDQCGHPNESYLGSDDKADYYLYNESLYKDRPPYSDNPYSQFKEEEE